MVFIMNLVGILKTTVWRFLQNLWKKLRERVRKKQPYLFKSILFKVRMHLKKADLCKLK